jgi:hypothetical protein
MKTARKRRRKRFLHTMYSQSLDLKHGSTACDRNIIVLTWTMATGRGLENAGWSLYKAFTGDRGILVTGQGRQEPQRGG